jgi:LAGLIDADG-like domain
MSWNHSSVLISISGHKYEDREYLTDYVCPMFANRFGITLKVLYMKDQNCMIVYARTKEVAMTLHEWGMPFRRKKLSNLTPNVALDEASFNRGLFDTDGCVYRKYGLYAQLQFKFASLSLLAYARDCLVKLGFHPTAITKDDTKVRFYLSRQAEVDHFFRAIGPKNPKHLKRFQNLSRKQSYRPIRVSLEHKRPGTDQAL